MPLSGDALAAVLVAVSFAAGLNVYATVAVLGLLAHAGWLTLPTALTVLDHWSVIAAAGVLFGIEFFADKTPGVDLVWNALQTFIRIPVAALLTYGATSQLAPGWHLAATLAAGLIAMVAHGGKMAARVAVTPSPEPLSNIALSVAEDALTIFITWMATQHPFIAAGIVVVLIGMLLLMIRWIVGALRRLFAPDARPTFTR